MNNANPPDTHDYQAILACPVSKDPTGPTVRDYFHSLLAKLWAEGENFNGKRPFGDSSWQFDIYAPLIEAGLIPGKLDEDGYVDDIDERIVDPIILGAIAHIFKKETNT